MDRFHISDVEMDVSLEPCVDVDGEDLVPSLAEGVAPAIEAAEEVEDPKRRLCLTDIRLLDVPGVADSRSPPQPSREELDGVDEIGTQGT
jgi:hypothetical protein